MNKTQDDGVHFFRVVCPHADEVYLLGAFNRWSTTATPMSRIDEEVWQLSLELPDEPPERDIGPAGAGAYDPNLPRRFSYFVIDKRWNTGASPLGNTYLLPDTQAIVVRRPGMN